MNPYPAGAADTEETSLSFDKRCLGYADFADAFRRRRRTRMRQSQNHASRTSTRRSRSNTSENSQVLYMANHRQKKTRSSSHALSFATDGAVPVAQPSSSDLESSIRDDIDGEMSDSIIDREIFDWQFTCQTGLPHWMSPQARYSQSEARKPWLHSGPLAAQRRLGPDTAPRPSYAAQRRAVSDNYLSDPSAVEDMAHLVAVQLLSSCFTPALEQTPSSHHTPWEHRSGVCRDERMISSLRMHTQFRYSPSFGHQAQNTSPVHLWSSTFDGPSPIPLTPSHSVGQENPDVAALIGRGLVDFSTEGRTKSGAEAFGLAHTCHCSQSGTSAPCDNPKTCSHQQVMARSIPRKIFIQPVKELVARRWHIFRQQISRSLVRRPGGFSPDPIPTPDSSRSGASSPVLSINGRARRRRARESSDIDSSSSISSTAPLHNSPVRGVFQLNDDSLSPLYRSLSDSLSYAPGVGTPSLGLNRADPSSSPDATSLSSTLPSYQPNPNGARPSYGLGRRTVSSRRNPENRRSMLSEVFTADDFEHQKGNRGILSAAGSALATPSDERTLEFDHIISWREVQTDSPEPDGSLADCEPGTIERQDWIKRSSTGTQIFTPSCESVELDGLPVGPSRDHWAGKGDRRERTYLF